MTTVINNPNSSDNASDSGAGIIIGVIVAILLIALFVVYGLPALNNTAANPNDAGGNDTTINVSTPLIPEASPNTTP